MKTITLVSFLFIIISNFIVLGGTVPPALQAVFKYDSDLIKKKKLPNLTNIEIDTIIKQSESLARAYNLNIEEVGLAAVTLMRMEKQLKNNLSEKHYKKDYQIISVSFFKDLIVFDVLIYKNNGEIHKFYRPKNAENWFNLKKTSSVKSTFMENLLSGYIDIDEGSGPNTGKKGKEAFGGSKKEGAYGGNKKEGAYGGNKKEGAYGGNKKEGAYGGRGKK